MEIQISNQLAYLMDGGVPAGTNMRPGEFGCFITRMRINMTTRLGNSNRKPRGIDMEEFPFSLIRRRKKDNRDTDFGFSFFQSSTAGVEGKLLYSRCKNPMIMDDFPESVQQAGCLALPLRSYLVTMQPMSRIEWSDS